MWKNISYNYKYTNNRLNSYLFCFICIFICLCHSTTIAQNNPRDASAQLPGKLADVSNSYHQIVPVESVFLHTDRSYYSTPDTVWFKAYLLSGLTHTFSSISGLIYIELISEQNYVVKRIAVPAYIGLSWSQIPLDQNLTDGYYTLRAYTNWMQNAGNDRMFTKRIYISNPAANRWMVNQDVHMSPQGDKQVETMNLTLKDFIGNAYDTKDLTWTLKQGDLITGKSTAKTNASGRFSVNIPIPDKTKVKGPLILNIKGKLPSENVAIPVFGDPAAIDLQFMPEGGHLVADLPVKIGFKAIATDGLGAAVDGYIADSKGNKITSFKSVHNGLGEFTLAPQKGETYTANITLKNGIGKAYPLPPVDVSGVTMHVESHADSLKISVYLSTDLVNNQPLLLSGFVNDVPYCEASVSASGQKKIFSFPKSLFPSGIVHFTIFNSLGQPVSERAAFVDHNDRLILSVAPSKTTYKSRDSIALAINMKTADGAPISAGSLSVAVTDDGLVKQDTLENNIVSSMLLASGIKGNIEDPAYYFVNAPSSAADLDLLLLTQGWVSYKWPEILLPAVAPKFAAEKNLVLSGTVTSSFTTKPVNGSRILAMVNGRGGGFIDTVTDVNGRFEFKNIPKADSLSFYVQARDAKNKKARLQVTLNVFNPPLMPETLQQGLPWYINAADSTETRFAKKRLADIKRKFSFDGSNVLDEVSIGGKKGIPNSRNLNGPGNADQILTEAQIEPYTEMTLIDFLTKNVEGMNLTDNRNGQGYRIRDKPVQFVVDSWPAHRFLVGDTNGANTVFDQLTASLNNIKMKDVLGVEVMASNKYSSSYAMMFSSNLIGSKDTAYIEITTRGGKGMQSDVSGDAANYRPVPITRPKQFYRPRYTVLSKPIAADIRPTIHWAPQLATSKAGETFTSFYAGDKPGIYTVIVQGADLRGLVGYKRLKLTVTK